MILVMRMPYHLLWRAWLKKVHLILTTLQVWLQMAQVSCWVKEHGVPAKLKADIPTLVNIHCVCHKLALACTDTVAELKFIKQVETTLRQLWQWLENSPKRMEAFLKIQVNLQKSKALSDKHLKLITRRLKKACSTRWLSFEKSVSAAKSQYEAILHTLSEFAETDSAALGLQKMLNQVKFLGALYILHEVLPKLSQLSDISARSGQLLCNSSKCHMCNRWLDHPQNWQQGPWWIRKRHRLSWVYFGENEARSKTDWRNVEAKTNVSWQTNLKYWATIWRVVWWGSDSTFSLWPYRYSRHSKCNFTPMDRKAGLFWQIFTFRMMRTRPPS